MGELPWVISVDDHVVEPPHVWQRWLPKALRDRGPRVERDTCETVIAPGVAAARYRRGGGGKLVDWWVYEDVLRPIPQVMACVGSPKEMLTLEPITFDELVGWCRDAGLMMQKIPERLEIVDALPRNETLNKVLKFKLREQFGNPND